MPALTVFALLALLAIGGCRADAAPGDEDSPEVELQGFQPVAGTSVQTANLATEGESPRGMSMSGSYKEWSGYLANVLFFDTAAREGRWLFPSNEYSIIGRRDIAPDSGRVRAIVFTVVTRDTNDNDRLDSEDEKSLVAAAPDGTGRRTLVPRFERDLGHIQVSPEASVFTYSLGGQPAAVELNLADLTSQPIALPEVPGAAL